MEGAQISLKVVQQAVHKVHVKMVHVADDMYSSGVTCTQYIQSGSCTDPSGSGATHGTW